MVCGDNLSKRNFLAFAYFKSGQIDEAREELISLIKETGNYIAYRQLIYLEKKQGNIDDAKIWAYECIDKFPQGTKTREQLISIAKQEGDDTEVKYQLDEIMRIKQEWLEKSSKEKEENCI